MKFFYPLALLLLFAISFNANAQTPQFAWTRSYTNYSSGYANNYIATDSRNGIYSFGTFDVPVMTVGNSTFTNAGSGDMILIKHDTTGAVLWAQSFGGPGLETATGICTDHSGNIIISGQFSNTISFGAFSLTSLGGGDIFVAKLDKNGTVLWAQRFGGNDNETISALATDADNKLYLGGRYASTDMTIGITALANTAPYNIFYCKLDSNGLAIWAKSTSSTAGFGITGISAYTPTRVQLYGTFGAGGTVNFTTPFFSSGMFTGYSSGFLVKIDSAGNYLSQYTVGNRAFSSKISKPVNDKLYITGSVNMLSDAANKAAVGYMVASSMGGQLSHYAAGLTIPINQSVSTSKAADLAISSDNRIFIVGYNSGNTNFEDGFTISTPAPNSTAYNSLIVWEKDESAAVTTKSLLYTTPRNDFFGQYFSVAADTIRNAIYAVGVLKKTGSSTDYIIGPDTLRPNASVSFVLSKISINGYVVPPLPQIFIGNDTTICAGSTINIGNINGAVGGMSPYQYSWLPAAAVASPTSSFTQVTPTTSGSYVLRVQDDAGHIVYDTIFINLVAPPAAPTITSSGPLTLCNGQTVTLTSSAGSNYLWSTGATTQSISVTAGGNYSVSQFSLPGCVSAAATVLVTVNPTPATPTISANGPLIICSGQNVVLTSSAGSGYLWSNGATTQSITVTAGGSYSVTHTNSSGCVSTAATIQVTVNPAPATPTIAANGPLSICAGQNVVLTSSAGSGYLWSTGATTQSITVTAGGSYSVTHTSSSGCASAAATMQVTVNPAPATPTIAANGPLSICAGQNVILTSSAGSGYLWSTGATTQSITVTAGGNYSVTHTNSSGCASVAATIQVTVNPTPATPTISANGPLSICAGQNVILTSSAGSGYLWSTGATTQSITVTNSGSYSLTQTNSAGCISAPALVQVTVNALPAIPTITQNGNDLVSSASAGNQWYVNGNIINGANGQTYSNAVTGVYTVKVTNSFGCSSISSPFAATFLVGRTTILRTGEEFVHNVSPNPVSENSVVSYRLKNASDVRVYMVSSNGRIAYNLLALKRQPAGYYSISIKEAMRKLNAGMYFIIYDINNERITDAIVIPK